MAGKLGELNRISPDHGLKMQGYGTHVISLHVEFSSAVHIRAYGGNRAFDVIGAAGVLRAVPERFLVNILL